jgi:ribosomal protein S18 acetylase RimI-like enzyme
MNARPEKIWLRAAVPGDETFLLAVYSSTRADELKQIPWTTEQKDAFLKMQFAAQSRHYAALYPQAVHSVIVADEIPVGRLYVDRSADRIHILDITVLPQYRNQSIGSAVLQRLLDEAGSSGKTVTIYVETFNPSARFFERLGFRKDQARELRYLMKWQARA